MTPDIKIGQQWYFFTSSTTFVVYKIENTRYEYYDGDLLDENTVVYLHGSNNSVMTKRPKEFTENVCKIISDNGADIPIDVIKIPVHIKNRLEKIDD